jgi:hypothetical protein
MSGHGHHGDALTRALRAVAADDETLGASEKVEARLLAEAHVIARARAIGGPQGARAIGRPQGARAIGRPQGARAIGRPQGARRLRVYAAAGALAAGLLVAMAVPLWRLATVRPLAVDPTGPAESQARSQPGEVATEFFPLMYSNVPVANGHTIRLELPQAALTSFGLEADDASGTVLADVLVGQDGLARAVRFVRPAKK